MIVLVTGSTDGHGRRVALDLAAAGHRVLLHGRSRPRGEEVLREAGGDAQLFIADLASLSDVRGLAGEVLEATGRLDALVNNAGVAVGERRLSEDGVELTFAVNYLAHVLLTEELHDALREGARAAGSARVVNVASIGQTPLDVDDPMLERGYDGFRAYAQSKLAQITWTFDAAPALAEEGITMNALHPATLMDTTMVRESFGRTQSTVEEGARATARLVLDPELEGVTGRYFDGLSPGEAHPQASDPEAQRRLRELTRALLDG